MPCLAGFLLATICSPCHGSSQQLYDSRYSFSLTTFDPFGKLGQVERAQQAASLGTPVLAVCHSDGIIMAAPQALPSPLVRDDGTPRFSRITPNIMVSHSGLGADGRVVVAAAQRLAVEHAYTFDEAIPVELFLEELSLLFQEYTMKLASRPFGCTLLVACVPDNNSEEPELYRIDPSGSVESVRTAIVSGGLANKNTRELKELIEKEIISESTLEESQTRVVELLREALQRSSSKTDSQPIPSLAILSASITKSKGLVVDRHEADATTESSRNNS